MQKWLSDMPNTVLFKNTKSLSENEYSTSDDTNVNYSCYWWENAVTCIILLFDIHLKLFIYMAFLNEIKYGKAIKKKQHLTMFKLKLCMKLMLPWNASFVHLLTSMSNYASIARLTYCQNTGKILQILFYT